MFAWSRMHLDDGQNIRKAPQDSLRVCDSFATHMVSRMDDSYVRFICSVCDREKHPGLVFASTCE